MVLHFPYCSYYATRKIYAPISRSQKKHLMRLPFITNIWIWHPSFLPNDWFKSYQSNHNQKCFVKVICLTTTRCPVAFLREQSQGFFCFFFTLTTSQIVFPLSASYVCGWHSDTSLGHIIINCKNAHFFFFLL